MSKSVQYARRSYTIAAGDAVRIDRDSSFITCLQASSVFKIRFNEGPENDFEAGLTYSPQMGFHNVTLRNPGAAPITVTVGFGKGEITDSRVTISEGDKVLTRQASPDVLTTGAAVNCPDVATTALLAADTLRREAVIVVPTTATGPVYIGGDAAAAAGQGIPVLPGQSFTLETSAAIYGRNDTGGAVAVAVASFGWSA